MVTAFLPCYAKCETLCIPIFPWRDLSLKKKHSVYMVTLQPPLSDRFKKRLGQIIQIPLVVLVKATFSCSCLHSKWE